ncbi:MAG: hypothetical protein AVDCRST_MAG36-1989 [uncultured Nocardioidaceae bacterium]|uniref:Uncharacterized protein n=1 Tax=uncultured Nocardioidaceae bacterium TaxID=253824 RepID=A0A6J4M885_9ACTN|nr:MAG: hypothetical protein AVDCRST_MAG36-1989 [uncultured Nocardioidaceae bacterium]
MSSQERPVGLHMSEDEVETALSGQAEGDLRPSAVVVWLRFGATPRRSVRSPAGPQWRDGGAGVPRLRERPALPAAPPLAFVVDLPA